MGKPQNLTPVWKALMAYHERREQLVPHMVAAYSKGVLPDYLGHRPSSR